MSFFEAGTKYLSTIKEYNNLSSTDKIEANHLLLAYEELMKADVKRLCKSELPILLELTETGRAISFNDIALADIIFRKTIELSKQNEDVLYNYSEFLNIHGWDLESLQLKSYLKEKNLKAAEKFVDSLVTFSGEQPINLSREPSALVDFSRGENVSVFTYIAEHYLKHLKLNLYSSSKKDANRLNWLDNKIKLYIPCIAEKDLPILHQFTLKGWAHHILDHDIIFRLYEKNFELEPDSDSLQESFCQLLSKRKMHDLLYNNYYN